MNYLVLDIGGSAIKYSMMSKEAEFITTGKVKTPKDSFEDLKAVIGSIYDEHKDNIEGIAISMPGVIDGDVGHAYTGGALTYNDGRDIVKDLQVRCPVKIVVENDGKCAALAEVWKGSLQDYNDGVVIVLGTGIGGGIITNRRLHRGKHFSAGEFSFLQTNIEKAFERESCWAYRNGHYGLIKAISKIKDIPVGELDGVKVFELINAGDEEALQVLQVYSKEIAIQIFNLQCILDSERFCIGGGISAQNILIEYIKNNVKEIYENLGVNLPSAEVVRCKFGNDSNQIGALYNYLTKTGEIS